MEYVGLCCTKADKIVCVHDKVIILILVTKENETEFNGTGGEKDV